MNSADMTQVALAGAQHDQASLAFVAVLVGGIVMVVVGLPALVMSYRLRFRRLDAAGAGDGGATQALWDTAHRMETRIGYLETVLDTEVPGWRNRSNKS